MKGEIINGKITKTKLSMEDYGVLTFSIFVDCGAWCCGIGGYSIGKGYLGADTFEGSAVGLEAMMRIMDVVGVDVWEEMCGHYVRVLDPGLGGCVSMIGNIINDKWFDIKSFFAQRGTE